MKEGLYEIVAMRRSNHGKWVFTARPITNEISLHSFRKTVGGYVINHKNTYIDKED